MPELKMYAQTYYGHLSEDERAARKLEEYDFPDVPVVVRPADGVRVVLGTHDYWDVNFPDVQIERRAGGWVLFLHPVPGDDPAGYVYFLDDGRSFFLKEESCSPGLRVLGGAEGLPGELEGFGE